MIFKHISQTVLLILSMFLLLSSVYAQSIIFSSDQWPKRWERAMQHQPMNGHVVPDKMQINNFKRVTYRKKNHQGWGQQRNEKRYSRSRTPEYNYQSYNRHEGAPINNGSNSLYGSPTGYYGNSIHTYPNMNQGMYPGMYPNNYSGIYPGTYSGMGMPGYGVPGYGIPGLGLPYPAPLYMAPGIYPGVYPGGGYPW